MNPVRLLMGVFVAIGGHARTPPGVAKPSEAPLDTQQKVAIPVSKPPFYGPIARVGVGGAAASSPREFPLLLNATDQKVATNQKNLQNEHKVICVKTNKLLTLGVCHLDGKWGGSQMQTLYDKTPGDYKQMIDYIEAQIHAHQPQILFIEGPSIDTPSEKIIDRLKNACNGPPQGDKYAQIFTGAGEAYLLLSYIKSMPVPPLVYGTEPKNSDLVARLAEKGFTADEVAGYLFLRAPNVRTILINSDDTALAKQNVSHDFTQSFGETPINVAFLRQVAERFLTSYQRENTGATLEKLLADSDFCKTTFQQKVVGENYKTDGCFVRQAQLFAESLDYRNEAMLSQVISKSQTSDSPRSLFIVGLSHVAALYPVLEALDSADKKTP